MFVIGLCLLFAFAFYYFSPVMVLHLLLDHPHKIRHLKLQSVPEMADCNADKTSFKLLTTTLIAGEKFSLQDMESGLV